MAKKAIVILADGFEEIEAITPIDVLRRADIEVIVAGLSSKTITGARKLKVETDILLDEIHGLPDALILPGGAVGAKNLHGSKKVLGLIQSMNAEKKVVAAICASPAFALAAAGVLDGKKATCYPGCEGRFPASAKFSEDRVVVDGNIITSRAPGTALEFALAIVRVLTGQEKAISLKEEMLVKD
jgi:4-methyl-5(b-hydroxyethyl)-thiazole monophosphate biosynthesis